MIKEVVKKWYGLDVINYQKMSMGVGANTYVVNAGDDKYRI